MAERDIIRNLIFRLGQSQAERLPAELDVHHADVDEQSGADLLRFLRRLAGHIRFYDDDPETESGNWSSFFPADEAAVHRLLTHDQGTITPHLGLLVAFLELYKLPQQQLNGLTGRHLDFFYRQVLRFATRSARADRVHLLLELKKNAPPVLLGPDHRFVAGKDRLGREQLYAPERVTVINHAKVIGLRSVFVDTAGQGRVLAAPVANSADGLGEQLDPQTPAWQGLGHDGLPPAAIGFALAAPVLRMQEGTRTATVTLTLDAVRNRRVTAAGLSEAFEIFLTGDQGWLGPFAPESLSLTDGGRGTAQLRFSLTVDQDGPPVVDYHPELHGGHFVAEAPVVQVLLRQDAGSIGYTALRSINLRSAAVSVRVQGMVSLTLENDLGGLNPTKTFLPFGPQPVSGGRLAIGCPEALAKSLSELTLAIEWQDAPPRFANRYRRYNLRGIDNTSFTATVAFGDASGWRCVRQGEPLFDAADGRAVRTLAFTNVTPSGGAGPSRAARLRGLERVKTPWAIQKVRATILNRPLLVAGPPAVPSPVRDRITLTLEQGFHHDTYRRRFVEQVVRAGSTGTEPDLPAEPYTPAVRALTLGYTASSGTVRIADDDRGPVSLDDFARPECVFFQVTPFGCLREHGYQRQQSAFQDDQTVSLLPRFEGMGHLQIGLADLRGGDSLSLLVQVAEGSGDPDLVAPPVHWSVLCDNSWRPLDARSLVEDATNGLLTSGIVSFVLPPEATTTNTRLPAGAVWLQAAVARNTEAVARFIEVAAGAVPLRFVDPGDDLAPPPITLPAGSITAMRSGPAAIKTIRQPYGSFGGHPAETEAHFHTRVAERLRHKNRCVTAWDYERIVLEAFPAVHRVKCIPHASGDCWLTPGHVLLVVVPDLRRQSGGNPFQPKVDADTLTRIADHVRARCPGQVRVAVRNPRYQQVLVDCAVRLHRGYAVNIWLGELDRAIISLLSPWMAAERGADLGFGGMVVKSVLLERIEALDYVDYIEEMRLYTLGATGADGVDYNEIRPGAPDAILVSAAAHRLRAI